MRSSSRRANKVLKIVLLGDGGVGKSSLMNAFVNERFDPVSYHTIGVEFLNKDMTSSKIKGVPSHTFTLQIWDTAGQERFKTLRTPFFRGADACLLTFAVDDSNSFDALDRWKEEFVEYGDVRDLSMFPFVVLGNKIDVSNDQKKISKGDAENWCQRQRANTPIANNPSIQNPIQNNPSIKNPINDYNWAYFETSAKDSTNVYAAFQSAVDLCARLYACGAYSSNFRSNSTVDLRSLPRGEGEGGCC